MSALRAGLDHIVSLDHVMEESWRIAEDAGWHDRPTSDADRIGTNLALIHSEVSEALEAYRKHGLAEWHGEGDKPEGMASELADVIIRVAELARMLNIDLPFWVEEKMRYNRIRADVPARDNTKKF